MRKISPRNFKHILRDIHKNTENRKFCFILGAGASYTSGIPTGGHLAKEWFKEIKNRYSSRELKDWIEEVALNEEDIAAHYGAIYRKRFESDKTSGYEFLVQAMKTAKPSLGHIVLAQILTKATGNCVLTTNFDSLIESSIYQYTDKTPLVCGHESLSGYARPSSIHPLIVKIHRDLLLSPKSDPDEISALDEGWKEPLDNIFSNHIPIVIGYGGNDGSLMNYFEKMNRPSNFFWCGHKSSTISKRVEKLIEDMDGSYVEIDGFDELMHELLWVFDEIKPVEEELSEITKSRIEDMKTQLDKITKVNDLEVVSRLEEVSEKELSAFEYAEKAEEEPDYEKRKEIYLEALEKFPNTLWLWDSFIYFMHFEKRDYLELNEYYLKALAIDSESTTTMSNYASFLHTIKKDYKTAEEYYLKTLSIIANDSITTGNYANFLSDIKRDYENAEKYYLKSLSLGPENTINTGNYANFLKNIRKNYKDAEKYYLKALSLNSEDIDHNGNYANFLSDITRDYESAEKYYLKSLSLDSEHPNNTGNYARFLFINNRNDEANKYLEKAFQLNNNEKIDLLIELWFYKYAHCLDGIKAAEDKIDELLKEGIQAIGWDLDENVRVAIENGHPNPEKLKELAERITTDKE